MLFLATAVWGIFWLPLRVIENAGVTDIWAVVGINVVPLILLTPWIIIRHKTVFNELKIKCLIGIGMGGGMALYAIAFLNTTVLRTTLLFYMSPIWATLLSILILKEKITIRRWLAIAVGFTGLILIVLGKDASDVTLDINRGDIFALLSGLMWGGGTVLINKSSDLPAMDMVPFQYFWATVICAIFLLTTTGAAEIPQAAQWLNALPLIFGFFGLIILPTIILSTRIAQILSPGRVCLLMMSEVLVAGISAPLIAGERVSALEWIAGLIIISATLIEVYKPNKITS